MYYKYLNEPSISRSMQSVFKGINKNARIGDGEFADMQNMSGDAYPLMMPRAKRTVAQRQLVEDESSKKLNGILGDVGFAAVWDSDFYYMGEKVEGLQLSNDEKKLVAMGAEILIYPDAMYYNTVTKEYGTWDVRESMSSNLKLKGFYIWGTWLNDETDTASTQVEYTGAFTYTEHSFSLYYTEVSRLPSTWNIESGGDTRFARYQNSLYYPYKGVFKTSGSKTLTVSQWKKVKVDRIEILAEYAPTPVKNTDKNIWNGFEQILLTKKTLTSGVEYLEFIPNDQYSIFKYIDDVYYNKGNIIISESWTSRTVPALDFICEHENRLWGCRYGVQVNGKTVNEIYCSALDDYKRWAFAGTTVTGAGDPYAMSVGDYGAFTGCVSLRGHLLFFKDDIVYRVSGNKPSNFTIDKIGENGLQEGCEKTLETIDGVLYYKSRNGVFAYDGSIPQKISDALGNYYYTDAVAGKHFAKYYISMVRDGERLMYVYDTNTGVWHVEDDVNVRFFTEYDGALYGGVDNNIVCFAGTVSDIFSEAESESGVSWYAETGDIGLESPYPKYYHRVLVRMDIDTGARVKISINTGDEWMLAADFTSAKKQTVTLPVVTPRCEHMRIRIEGKGVAKIYSIYYETETVEGRP